MPVNFYAAKGGQGVTTVAAAYVLAHGGAIAAHDRGDLHAVMGLAQPADIWDTEVSPTVALMDWDYRERADVRDWGTNLPDLDGTNYLVTRPCYLALRRAAALTAPDGIILIREPWRSLRESDVTRALDAPIVAVIEHDPAVARCVDAGLLVARRPRALDLAHLAPEVPCPS